MGRKKRAGARKKEGALFMISADGISGNYRHGVRVGEEQVEVLFVEGQFVTDDRELISVLEAQAARPGAGFARVV